MTDGGNQNESFTGNRFRIIPTVTPRASPLRLNPPCQFAAYLEAPSHIARTIFLSHVSQRARFHSIMPQSHDNNIELEENEIPGNAQVGNTAGGDIQAPGNHQNIAKQNIFVPHSRTDLARPGAGAYPSYQNEAPNQDPSLVKRHMKSTVVLAIVAIVAMVVVLAAVLGTRHDSTRPDSDSGSDDTVSGLSLAQSRGAALLTKLDITQPLVYAEYITFSIRKWNQRTIFSFVLDG